MAGLITAKEGMPPIGIVSRYVTEGKTDIVPGALTMNGKVKPWTLRKMQIVCGAVSTNTFRHHMFTLSQDGELYFAPLDGKIQVSHLVSQNNKL
jgi:hypothetical protein